MEGRELKFKRRRMEAAEGRKKQGSQWRGGKSREEKWESRGGGLG